MIERIVLSLVALAGFFAAGVYVGGARAERKHAEQEVKQIQADAKTVEQLRRDDNQREVIYRDRIKIVRESVDNCLAQPIAGPVLDRLRDATGATARSASH